MPVTNQKAPKLVARSSLGRAVGDHPRENALGQRHVRAPQRRADDEAGEAAGLGEDEIAGDQHRHSAPSGSMRGLIRSLSAPAG